VTTLFTSQALATPEAEAFRADPTPKLWSKQGAAVLSRGALQPTVHGQSAAVREERRIASMIVRQSSEEKSSQHKPSLREESLELFVRGWSYEEIAEKLNAT
jgi:hypothetical protein